MDVLFFGNCQCMSLCEILKFDTKVYNVHKISCFKTDISKVKFTELLSKCIIVITQPINDNYRNVDYLNTSYIIKSVPNNCKIAVFDSCYFKFYYPDLRYIQHNNENLHEPIDYHHDYIIKCYKNNISIDECISKYINNKNLFDSQELLTFAQESIDELIARNEKIQIDYGSYENVNIIGICDFVKQNYKEKLLFYSMNHPSKYILQYIAEQVCIKLKIKTLINYSVDPLGDKSRCILYACIQKVVNFDITNNKISVKKINNIKDIVKLYYTTYKNKNF